MKQDILYGTLKQIATMGLEGNKQAVFSLDA